MASKSGNPSGLTDMQLKFCQEYTKSLNATQAYIRAGYSVKSERVASAAAARLLASVRIRAYLGEVLNLDEVSVVSEVVAIAFANITDVVDFDANGVNVKSSAQISNRAKSSLQSVKFTTIESKSGTIRSVEVKMHDKLSALDKLMKKLKLYPKELTTVEAVRHLLSQGLLTEDQAKVIIDGISGIEEGLRSLTSGKPEPSEPD